MIYVIELEGAAEKRAAWDLFKAMGKTGAKLYTSAGAMMERVTSGEHLIAYGVFGSYALGRSKKDPNLGIILPQAIAKWALLAPIFIPLFLRLGVDPAAVLAAYRVGLFPMRVDGELIWWSPVTRAVIERGGQLQHLGRGPRGDLARRRGQRVEPARLGDDLVECRPGAEPRRGHQAHQASRVPAQRLRRAGKHRHPGRPARPGAPARGTTTLDDSHQSRSQSRTGRWSLRSA